MSHDLLHDASFFSFLLSIDADIAAAVKAGRCPFCGAPLDTANFRRKVRGGPSDVPDDLDLRHSFCCRRDGCRHRKTPASVRFAGRRVYLGLVTVIVAIMRQGASPDRLKVVTAQLGVSRQAIKSWVTYWRDLFPETVTGRSLQGIISRAGSSSDLVSLLVNTLTGRATSTAATFAAWARVLGHLHGCDHVHVGKIATEMAAAHFTQRTVADT